MCAIATPSATACFAAAKDKDIPVIFTAITDPKEAKLDEGNVTGTSDKLPVEEQLKLIRTLQPDAKTIGIIYTTSEPNSISAIEEYKSSASKYDFKIEAIGITAQSEAVQAAETLISKGVDCFSNLTDNNVVGVLPSILEKQMKQRFLYTVQKLSRLKRAAWHLSESIISSLSKNRKNGS